MTPEVTNGQLARALARIATLLEIDGANSFKVRAYREGARVVEQHGMPLASCADEAGALEAIPGIGRSIALAIREFCASGRSQVLDELSAKYPDEVAGFLELQGLGPKRVKMLFDSLGIRTRADLGAAAAAGRLRDLPGFGEKVEQTVLQSLARSSQWQGRMLLAEAWPLALGLAERVRSLPGVVQVELAGSFRRRKETIGDLDLLVAGGDSTQVMQTFVSHPAVADVLGRGDTKSSVRLASGLQVDLRVVPEASFGAALMYFTGSKEHNIELRRLAIERGWSLNEYGLTQGTAADKQGAVVAARTEEDVYGALGLAWIPPELRECRGEIALAREGRLPQLIELEDLRADLHMHTTRTDGRESIDTMVEAAIARGYEYVAITEHSKALAMANGFNAQRVRQSIVEIADARARHPQIRILHGIECDILADGALDLDDDTLALLDWVVISIHSRFEMTPEAATQRALRAVTHPAVHAFGHPTGRMIGTRESVPFDVGTIAEAAAARGVALEINAAPDRLDLSDVNARLAREKGARFVIDTDAHATSHFDFMRWGVCQARRAGLTRSDVLNVMPWNDFERHLTWRKELARTQVAMPAPAPAAAAPSPQEKLPLADTGEATAAAMPASRAARRRSAKG